MLSVEEIVAKSSNVGTAKIALDLPAQTLGTPIPASASARRRESIFRRRHRALAACENVAADRAGHDFVRARCLGHAGSTGTRVLVFANDGLLMPLTLLKADTTAMPVRAMSAETARAMRKMLEMAVGPEGTAPLARIPAYRVAGKTGTAYKIKNGQYVKEYVASFVASRRYRTRASLSP